MKEQFSGSKFEDKEKIEFRTPNFSKRSELRDYLLDMLRYHEENNTLDSQKLFSSEKGRKLTINIGLTADTFIYKKLVIKEEKGNLNKITVNVVDKYTDLIPKPSKIVESYIVEYKNNQKSTVNLINKLKLENSNLPIKARMKSINKIKDLERIKMTLTVAVRNMNMRNFLLTGTF